MREVRWNCWGAKEEVIENVGVDNGVDTMTVQIFGLKNSQATRAAERFFKERRVGFQFVDLKRKAMAPAEIKRFIDRFGLTALLDSEGKIYNEAGLKYLRLPLVRAAARLSIGLDQDSWKEMLNS
jgi:arsenate reductase (glutaredoxin)